MRKDEYFRQIQENFGNNAVISPGWIVMFVGVLIVIVSGLSLRHWWRTRRDRPTPMLSFMALAGKLGLSPAEQWLLIRMATKLKLPTPITLLVSPRTLKHHGKVYADRYARGRSARLMRKVDAIAGKLFAA